MKTVLIIDDEEDARKLIAQYLGSYPNLKIIGEAAHGIQAVREINAHRPDIVFLDIQMPGLNGFEVLSQLEVLPEIIFSTAYDSYALNAFEVQAMDYLLKPYGKNRFEQAISRLEKNHRKVEQLAEQLLQQRGSRPHKIIVSKGRRRFMVNVAQIQYLLAYGDYTKVHTQKESFLSTSGISKLLEKLNNPSFIQIHRSHVVNIDHLAYLTKEGRYHYVTLETGTKLKISDFFLPVIKSIQF